MSVRNWFWRLLSFYAASMALLVALVSLLVAQGTGWEPSSIGLLAAIWSLGVAAVFAGWLATRYCIAQVVDPLEQLARRMCAIAVAGDDNQTPIETNHDVGLLTAAFEQLQRKLDRRVDQFEENSVRLQSVLGSMAEGVLAVGADKTILLANEAGRQLLDFVTAEPVGRSLLEVTRARPVYEAVGQALDSAFPVEREFESPGMQRRRLSLRATRLAGDPCPGVMIVLHDVSELRRLENLRRELVANVSHELKTPLAAIKAYAETLRMGAVNDPENNLTFVIRIEEQAERLHQLILDMLQIARVESGQETFEIVEVPLSEVSDECASQFVELAAAKQIDLQFEMPPQSLTVRADEEGIRTILSNLVDNAIKYTPNKGTVSVRWRAAEQTVTLEVQDTGIGIAAKEQTRIFERFYRVDRARSRELGGTGLGLSIVKHLAQAFGGVVGIDSEPHRGSTFRVQLPRGNNQVL